MTTPFPHAHVSFVSKTARRRSRSLSIINPYDEKTGERSMGHKQFLAQLQLERQKAQSKHGGHDEHHNGKGDRAHTVVSRVHGASSALPPSKQISSLTTISVPLKKQISSNTHKTSTSDDYDDDEEEEEEEEEKHHHHHHHHTGAQMSRGATMTSMKKQSVSTGFLANAPKDEITSVSSGTMHSNDNEKQHGHHSHAVRTVQSEMKTSLNKQISNKISQNSDPDSLTMSKVIRHDSSKTSSHIFQSSSINLISKSEIFDQDFYLDDPSHARKNAEKNHGKINISGREKHYTGYDRKMAARSSASCMAATIAIIIALIAFAFGLAALILVLLLRSSVTAQLAAINSTSSSSTSGSTDVVAWTTACSNYTELNDPTRSVFATGYPLNCDNTAPFSNRTSSVWIRFTGTGGTILPLTTPGMNICGSEGTGWYSGTMPSSGEIINGTACFTWYNSVCRFSQAISVANCGSYYTYYLPPVPACMSRYCTI